MSFSKTCRGIGRAATLAGFNRNLYAFTSHHYLNNVGRATLAGFSRNYTTSSSDPSNYLKFNSDPDKQNSIDQYTLSVRKQKVDSNSGSYKIPGLDLDIEQSDQRYRIPGLDMKDQLPFEEITSSKALQDAIFKKARKAIQGNKGLLIGFNLLENNIKKISIPLFDALYATFADKDGVSEDNFKIILKMVHVLLISILLYSLFEVGKSKLNAAEKLDEKLCDLYKEAGLTDKEWNKLAKQCAQATESIAEWKKDINTNYEILALLDECAKSNNDQAGIFHELKIFLQEQIASISQNKPTSAIKPELKIKRELTRMEASDPSATLALNKMGTNGVNSTVNTIKTENLTLNVKIEKKEYLRTLDQDHMKTKEVSKDDTYNKAEKGAKELEKKLVVRLGFYKPQYRDIQEKEKCSHNYVNSSIVSP